MKIHDCEQGSEAWFAVRRGIPTASHFAQILTPKERKYSKSAGKYADKLLAEWLIGESVTIDASGFMARGTDMEAEARSWYEFDQDVDVVQVGFVTSDDGGVGCSPDGLVGDDGIVEFKCPSAHVHVGMMLASPDDYLLQVQGNLWLTGRHWAHRVSYHPTMPRVIDPWLRDEELIGQLGAALERFNHELAQKKARLLAMGAVPA